ncbi:glycosyltransferase [Methylobacterium oryzisoli]|uniref:glycosyltransferase n=1 Tax=Methylobacterium oryzisoli TaxID=3385502 RepID=UPI0038921530
MSRILIAVTHLLGAGHLTRAVALARAFAGAGHGVTLVSGGMPAALALPDGVRLVQLPPVRITGTAFTALLDPEGEPVTPARLAERRAALLDAFADSRPEAVITELHPFGRRVLAAEFDALVEAARAAAPRPRLLASVRDVLARPGKPERVAAAHARLAAYDAVLVHGDPDLLPLDRSWPVDAAIAPLLHYTGYVDEAPAPLPVPLTVPLPVPLPPPGPRRGVVVSGGSSAAGLPLQEAALGAARLRPDEPWRVLVGRGVPEAAFAALRDSAPPNAVVERARPDFRALLAGAALSVSQAGYNTVLDLLRSGCPAVLVPFEAGRETEQRLRADTLAARGLARVLPEAALSAERLAEMAAEMAAALLDGAAPALAHAAPRGTPPPIALDGAARSVAIVEGLLARTPSLPRPALAESDWACLRAALDRRAGENRPVALWWRDDDATAHTPALDRLLALSRTTGWPLALAVIPAGAEPSLSWRLAGEAGIDLLVHGLAHANHAPPGAKKAELAHRPAATLEAEVAQGLALARALRPAPLPVLVPPWNRLAPDLAAALPRLGFRGLSTFGPCGPAVPGLVQVNTHLDPVAWRTGRGLADPRALLARAAATLAAGETRLGLLTHHLVQDAATWAFCEALLERLRAHPAVRVARADALFAPEASPVSQTDARVSPAQRLQGRNGPE